MNRVARVIWMLLFAIVAADWGASYFFDFSCTMSWFHLNSLVKSKRYLGLEASMCEVRGRGGLGFHLVRRDTVSDPRFGLPTFACDSEIRYVAPPKGQADELCGLSPSESLFDHFGFQVWALSEAGWRPPRGGRLATLVFDGPHWFLLLVLAGPPAWLAYRRRRTRWLRAQRGFSVREREQADGCPHAAPQADGA